VISPDFTAALARATGILRRQKEGKRIAPADLAFCQRIAEANAPGRPRETAARLPVYSSMAECSGATGIPLTLLKQAKRTGCEAFQWNRVDLAKFLSWVFGHDNESEDGMDWGNELKKWLAKRAKLAHDRDNGALMPVDQVAREVRASVTVVFADLDRVFTGTLPPVLKGLGEVDIRTRCGTEIERVKETMRARLLALMEEGGKKS